MYFSECLHLTFQADKPATDLTWQAAIEKSTKNCHLFSNDAIRTLQEERASPKHKIQTEFFTLTNPVNKLAPSHFKLFALKIGDKEYVSPQENNTPLEVAIYFASPLLRKFVFNVEYNNQYTEEQSESQDTNQTSQKKKSELKFTDIEKVFFTALRGAFPLVVS